MPRRKTIQKLSHADFGFKVKTKDENTNECLQLESLSGPIVFGGEGRLRMTSLASCDLLTMTSFSRTAVCIRRTLEVSLRLE